MEDRDEDSGDALLKALAWTPQVVPFTGTDRYTVVACLGEGGFGVVYEVADRETGRRVALKTLKPQRSGFAANIRRLKREFRSVADLAHPNLVGLHDLASHGDRWFFTMDLVRGVDFQAYARACSEAGLRSALAQLASGVAALHEAGIVHRDLKPSNVLVGADGRVVILDFGLAGDHDPDDELDMAGTPTFMAPEQAERGAVTAAVDWYALGVMLYEALTGTLPGPKPVLNESVAPDLARLCLALLQRDPAARPSDRAILEQLGQAAPRRIEINASFVGRTRELAALAAAFEQRGLIRIHGAPGVGKSALVTRFLDTVRDRAVVLEGHCYEREAVPFKAFDGVIDALARYLQALPRPEAIALLPADVHLVTQLFPVLDSVDAIHDVPRAQTVPTDPREQRVRAFTAIKELLARIADKRPLVIAIDDLQWSDVDSARLLSQLVSPPARPSLLLMLCYRSDDAEQPAAPLQETLRMLATAGDAGRELAVTALTPADAEALATQLLGAKAGGRDAVGALAQRGEGHPLFMRELARIRGTTGAPLSLIDMLWQRVTQLSDTARALLETIAIAGQPVASGLCFEAAGLGNVGVDAVRMLRAEQLVRAGDSGLIDVFHDRVRDAVLLRADATTQRVRHLALARTLERTPERDLEALARHFDAADEHELAAGYAVRAGDAAMTTLAFERAASLYQLAIDRQPARASGGLYEKLGAALLDGGHNAAAGEAFLAGAALSEGARATDLMRRGGEQLLIVGDHERGYLAIERAMAAVGERLPVTIKRAKREMIFNIIMLHLRGLRFKDRGLASFRPERLLCLDVMASAARGLDPTDPARAMAISSRFSRRALATGEPQRAASGLVQSVFALCGKPTRPAAIDDILDEAIAIGQRIGDPEVVAEATKVRGLTHFSYGDWPTSARLSESAAALMSQHCIGMWLERRTALLNTASSYIRVGALADAKRVGHALLLDAEERGDPIAEKNVCVGVHANLSLAADSPASARQYLDRCTGEDRCISILLYGETACALGHYLHQHGDGIAAWRARWARLQCTGIFFVGAFRTITVRSLAAALIGRAEGPHDLDEAAKLVRWIRRFRFPFATATTAALRAMLAMRDDRDDKAVTLLRAAAEDYDRASMLLDAASCRYRAAELAGDATAAAAALEQIRACGVANPERWAAMVMPRFEPAPFR